MRLRENFLSRLGDPLRGKPRHHALHFRQRLKHGNQFGRTRLVHEHAGSRNDGDETLRREHQQGFAHRSPGTRECIGQCLFVDLGARAQGSGLDIGNDMFSDLIL
ncbi:hypothetical protein D9M68_781900 [compost metagenome]